GQRRPTHTGVLQARCGTLPCSGVRELVRLLQTDEMIAEPASTEPCEHPRDLCVPETAHDPVEAGVGDQTTYPRRWLDHVGFCRAGRSPERARLSRECQFSRVHRQRGDPPTRLRPRRTRVGGASSSTSRTASKNTLCVPRMSPPPVSTTPPPGPLHVP